ncbi:3'(2'),5'-bisphosphate nucleotidase CysQ [Candidatus Pacearchaeota archaeon]|nr:3'(2'),5'-bisphosphate nucleotidase CysQ [Candidatus Pacearchaeota archaeon]
MKTNKKAILKQIIDIAKSAGEIAMKYHGKELDIETKSHEHDFLTQVDIESDKYIREEIGKLFPEDEILSEESKDIPSDYSGRVWMIDPLDGTKDFVYKGRGFSVMIGLCVNGEPMLGVVYAPARETLYYAEEGTGAYVEKNKEKIDLKVSEISELKSSKIVTRIIHREKRDLDKLVDSIGVKSEMPESSVGIKLGLIAEGKADLHINTNYRCSKWDTCAPQIILEEAGGIVSDFSGNPLNYKQKSPKWENSFVASNHNLHKKIITHISENI